ncbi:hypothetical protein C8A01DRAFT_50091 [Parachaetomium inaequale]|uniref:Large ribosomal subunit protein mL50 n=1 Tax=Parachaetomium inaequale TaxID=2588326 RepID=A0AAN6PC64_9PEZI|nr:hypothetical protein C8A01DRAFT_50091 [Parachaetomium inaequale]
MRRLPRLRAPAPAGFAPSSIPSGPLRAPAAAAVTATPTLPPTPRLLNSTQTRRYLSSTPMRASQPQTQPQVETAAEELDEQHFDQEEYLPTGPAEINTQLVYPQVITTAPDAASVTDPTYTPAETSDGLEEVGGLAGWWDEPAHWGSEGGAARFVHSVVSPFGPAERVTDPAVLEVLAKRAIVEALVVARFAGAERRKAVDRLFAYAGASDRLGRIVGVEVVAGQDGAATLKEARHFQRVWCLLKSAVTNAKKQQQQAVDEVDGVPVEAIEGGAEAVVPGVQAEKAAPAPQLTPQYAKQLMGSWNKEWKKAELRDPVVKFFAAKRIQQLTGHRIADGKLLATATIDDFLKQLAEPAKPLKLAELVETKAVFKGLPNVRVFPRRVTPIDKEQQVGRWKIIVKELEKRELPVTGTAGYGPPIEKRWVEGHKVATLLSSEDAGASERTAQLKEVLAALKDESEDGLAAVVEKLADGARDVLWRLPLGESGLLEFVLSAVPVTKEPQHPLNKQALRLVGNACADCDDNRARVVSSGALRSFIVEILKDPGEAPLLPFATVAALNFCLDYNTEPKVANPNTPALLLGLATSERYDVDLDAFMEICAPALAYLTFQDFQPVLVENGGIELLQLAFYQLYTRFDIADADPDTASQLKQTLVGWLASSRPVSHLQTAACLSLGNLSRSDESSAALLQRVQEPLIDILTRAIPPTLSQQPPKPQTSAPPLQLTHAALSFLKNLAIPQVNKPLLGAALLDPANPLLPRLWTSTRTQPQLQFTAVSLTRLLLANCPANIRHICTPTPASNPQDTSNSTSNLALLTATAASADEDPIKIEAARAVSQVCRALHSSGPAAAELLDPSWTWSSSTAAEKENEESDPDPLARFYTTHAPKTITPSLHLLLTHPRFPALHSETIFVLALMARSSSSSPNSGGTHTALQVLQRPTPASQNNGAAAAAAGWQVIAKAITGSESAEIAALFTSSRVEEVKDDEAEKKEVEDGVTVERLSLEPQQVDVQGQKQQPARVAKMDRENGMVLVAELLRQFPEKLASLRRPLEALLNKGGELVIQNRGEEHK